MSSNFHIFSNILLLVDDAYDPHQKGGTEHWMLYIAQCFTHKQFILVYANKRYGTS